MHVSCESLEEKFLKKDYKSFAPSFAKYEKIIFHSETLLKWSKVEEDTIDSMKSHVWVTNVPRATWDSIFYYFRIFTLLMVSENDLFCTFCLFISALFSFKNCFSTAMSRVNTDTKISASRVSRWCEIIWFTSSWYKNQFVHVFSPVTLALMDITDESASS